MRKALIGLALTTALVATPAMARDGAWYGGVEAGALWGESLDVAYDTDGDGDIDKTTESDLIKFRTDMGADVDLVLGYDFGAFRLEGEAGFKSVDLDRFESVPGFDLNPATPAVDTLFDGDGDANMKTLMLNALVDIGRDGAIQLYGGAGIGYSWFNIDAELEDVPGPFVDDTDGSWAWQGIVGLRIPATENAEFGLKYRYFNVEDVSMLTPGGDRFDTDFRSHSLLASLIFNFGRPAAPPPPPPPPQAAPPPAQPAPQPPAMKDCPDGSRIPVAQQCPVPPPPVVEPSGERG